MRARELPVVPVGFDYGQTVLRINRLWSYQRIAEHIGYSDRSAVHRIVKGQVPPHPQGEALWALYVRLFNEKPPHSADQRTGKYQSVALPQQAITPADA